MSVKSFSFVKKVLCIRCRLVCESKNKHERIKRIKGLERPLNATKTLHIMQKTCPVPALIILFVGEHTRKMPQ